MVAGFSMVSGPRARDWLAWWIGEGRHIETVVDGTALIQEGVEVGPRIGCGITAGLAASRDGGGAEEQWKAAIHSARPLQES